MDEPTSGLDVEARHRLWEILRAFVADGGAVLLTTHNLEEAQALASRVVVIAGGELIAHGSVEEIVARVGLSRVHLRARHCPTSRRSPASRSTTVPTPCTPPTPTRWSGPSASRAWRSPDSKSSGPAWKRRF